MIFHVYAKNALKHCLRNISSAPTKKSSKKLLTLNKNSNLDLAYASYECTNSYSEKNPQPTPIVILHDLLGSKNNWNSFCKKLHSRKKCKIIALDSRNHGESPHSLFNSYDDLAIDLQQFMDKKNLKTVSLLGHSVGGRTAMVFALKYPELVEKLIVADISPVSSSPAWKQASILLQTLDKMKLPKSGTFKDAAQTVGENLSRFVKSRVMTTFLLTNLVKQNDGSFAWRFNVKAMLRNFNYIESFPELHNLVYNGQVLFVGGAKSDHIQKSDFPKIQKLFPNAELEYIEGAGHWLHSEKPEEFLNLTINFLNKPVVHK